MTREQWYLMHSKGAVWRKARVSKRCSLFFSSRCSSGAIAPGEQYFDTGERNAPAHPEKGNRILCASCAHALPEVVLS